MDNTKIIKMVENGLVIIVLFAVIIILIKPVEIIINNVKMQSARESTRGIIKETRTYYTNLTIFEDVYYPFKIVFNEKDTNGYTLYSMGQVYIPVEHIIFKIRGEMPTSGSVELINDGEAVATNLKIGKFICNKVNANAEEVCLLENNEIEK